jgi:hypothetical protein
MSLPEHKAEELREAGFASQTAAANSAGISLNALRDRWLKLDWTLERALREPLRGILRETKAVRQEREAQENATGLRICTDCGLEHPMENFRKSKISSNGHFRVCISCMSAAMREERYGVSKEEYQRMHEQQGGLCFGCGQVLGDRVHVEHHHATGLVRGLACPECNWTIGDFEDHPDRMDAACVWLTKHTGPPSEPIGEPVQNPRANATAYIFWRDYGLTEADVLWMHEQQQGRCGICRQEKSLTDLRVDHHHAKVDKQAIRRMEKTLSDGRCRPEDENRMRRASVRGLLCAPCNKGLGHADEDVARLQSLSRFLRQWFSENPTAR